MNIQGFAVFLLCHTASLAFVGISFPYLRSQFQELWGITICRHTIHITRIALSADMLAVSLIGTFARTKMPLSYQSACDPYLFAAIGTMTEHILIQCWLGPFEILSLARIGAKICCMPLQIDWLDIENLAAIFANALYFAALISVVVFSRLPFAVTCMAAKYAFFGAC